jgi:hypothetical protein
LIILTENDIIILYREKFRSPKDYLNTFLAFNAIGIQEFLNVI